MDMQQCIDHCLKCHSVCLATGMRHCLGQDGRDVEPDHFHLLMACAEFCMTAARFMLIGVDRHKRVCSECADICKECAIGCARIGDMDDCVAACRLCEASCREMAASPA